MGVRQQARRSAPGGKVSVPLPGAHVVLRPGPTGDLEAAVAAHRVTAVVAPAGYGKTTLVASWAAGTTAPVAWLALDPSDDDPDRLLRGLEGALAGVLPAGALPADVGAVARLDALLVVLGDRTDPVVLVLDDAHEVHGTAARAVLGRLVRYAPAVLRLVLVARADPGVPLHRLRVAGELGELRAGALAFGADEIVRVAEASGTRLDRAEAERLRAVTDGWPVAVRMTLLGMAGADGTEGAGGTDGTPGTSVGADAARRRRLDLASATAVPVADYVVDEVLAGLPPALADFVLRATVDDVVDPVLADVLVPGGAALLDACVARGLFLTPVPDGAAPAAWDATPAYRWHALFAAQCRVLQSRRDPGALARTHRAVAVHRRDTDWSGAVRHACAAGDGALAVDVLRAHWPEVLVAGDTALLRRLCALVVGQGRRDAWVLLAQAAADVLDGRGDVAVFPQVRRAVESWGADDDVLARVLTSALRAVPEEVAAACVTSSAGATVAGGADGPGVDDASDAPAGGTDAADPQEAVVADLEADDVDPRTRALALYLVGRTQAHAGGDPADAAAHLVHGAAVADASGLPTVAAACRAEHALLLADTDDLAVADATAADVLEQGVGGSAVLAPAHLARGVVAYWQDRLADACGHLEDAVAVAGPAQRGVTVRAAATLALACHARDDRVGFERARRRVEDAVRAAADEHADLAALGEIVAAHARTPAEVVSALRGALAVAAVDEPAAHRLLERALDVAERAGVRRPFVELEPVLHDLLVEHLRWGSAHEEVVAALVAGDAPRRGPRGAWGSLELTEREHQVLVRLRSTMTTTEIAAALFVSGNTVKTHQRSIYRKLGVAGRRDALRVAAERGLL